jgi:hypothetical protein
MTALDPNTANVLAKICGMFGSDHDGERATAAAKADQLIRSHGLRWSDIITPPTLATSIEEQIDFALSRDDLLNAWEEGFLGGIKGRQFLTQKQLAKLGCIMAKIGGKV